MLKSRVVPYVLCRPIFWECSTTPFWQGILEHSEEAGTFTKQPSKAKVPAVTKVQANHAQALSHLVRSVHKNLQEDMQVEEKWDEKQNLQKV